MKLDINLYQDEFRTTFRPFGLSTLVVLLLVVLLAGLAWRAVLGFELRSVEGDIELVAGQIDGLEGEIEDLSSRLGSEEAKKRIQQRITGLREAIGERERLLADMSIDNGTAGRLPSAYLEGVARQAGNGLWLSHLAVDHRSDQVEIRGHATDPSRVPAFVGQLGDEIAFRGLRFRRLVISRNLEREDWVDFRVMTSEEVSDDD